MSTKKKLLEAAAGNAGGGGTYVDDVFSTYLYTGTSSAQTITNNIDLADEGGLVWIKNRDSGSDSHALFDTARGPRYHLASNTTMASTDYGAFGVNSFNSNGFSLIGDGTGTNRDVYDYASWSFRKAPGFFDVVTYTGNSSTSQTISHNLGAVPGMIITKATSATTAWYVYHVSLGNNAYAVLNASEAASVGHPIWNNTTPTSTEFTVGSQGYNTNNNGTSYVAYLFAHDAQDFGTDEDESIIKCGSYTGNGSSTAGPTIDLGFEPQFILQKAVDRTANWYIYDSMRGIVTGGDDTALIPNTSSAEYVAERLALTASGFQITTTNGNFNQSGEEYIYMAIRRPHKPAEEFAATDLFAIDSFQANDPSFVSGFPVDMSIERVVNSIGDNFVKSRLTGARTLWTNANYAESNYAWQWDYMDGNGDAGSSANSNHLNWMWRRAPGYFDVVTYEGNSSNPRTVAHNLGTVPEMIWIKSRGPNTAHWRVYDSINGPTKGLWLNQTYGSGTEANWWSNTAPTNALFTLGGDSGVNAINQSFIAYLFASVAGISKFGSYTGTGNDLNVDCGFSAGARFILIKRTDELYGDNSWYVWDSLRGIVAGNDPYLLLNTTAAQVTNTDYIDPLASGFTVTSSAPAALNASGGTYIFYAIA